MPGFDLPLAELHVYQGTNPRPLIIRPPHPGIAVFHGYYADSPDWCRLLPYVEPRIRAAVPVFPFLSDYRRVWDLDLAVNAYAELRDYLRRFDPLHESVEQMWLTLGDIDVQHLAPRVRASVMMHTGLMDMICPPSTQFAAYNKLPSEKQVTVYPDFEHEDLPGIGDRILRFFVDQLGPSVGPDALVEGR